MENILDKMRSDHVVATDECRLVVAGSKELLLEQRVPASYLALEDVICHLAAERRNTGVDPVLNAEQYKTVVTAEMQYRYQRSFRDAAELHQATLFLHENGVCRMFDTYWVKGKAIPLQALTGPEGSSY
jgi:hypothetical protein